MYLADFYVYHEGEIIATRDVAVYHDADTDRQSLHDRFAAWRDSKEGARWISDKVPKRVDSFEFRQPDGSFIHTIVATFTPIAAKENAKARVSKLYASKSSINRTVARLNEIRDSLSTVAMALEELESER